MNEANFCQANFRKISSRSEMGFQRLICRYKKSCPGSGTAKSMGKTGGRGAPNHGCRAAWILTASCWAQPFLLQKALSDQEGCVIIEGPGRDLQPKGKEPSPPGRRVIAEKAGPGLVGGIPFVDEPKGRPGRKQRGQGVRNRAGASSVPEHDRFRSCAGTKSRQSARKVGQADDSHFDR